MWVPSLVSLSGLRIRHGRALWCSSQTHLESGIHVAGAVGWKVKVEIEPKTENFHMLQVKPKKEKKKKMKKHYRENKMINGWRGGGMARQSTEDF